MNVPVDTDQSQPERSRGYSALDDGRNDVTRHGNTTPESTQSLSQPGNMSVSNSYITVTSKPTRYPRKPIYHRGHLLYHLSKDKRILHAMKGLRDPGFLYDFREESEDANSRMKRKHSDSHDRLHNYNMVYDQVQMCDYLHSY